MTDPKTYLLRTKAIDWDSAELFALYKKKKPDLAIAELIPIILDELTSTALQKPGLVRELDHLQNTFKLILDINKSPASGHMPGLGAIKVGTWKSRDVFNNINTPCKRKQPDAIAKDTVSVKKGKKEYNFTPQPTPSVSTHKSRISDEDRAVLAPLYCIKINDHHLNNTPQTVCDAYEKNLEDQSMNASLVKRPRAFAFLKDALNQPLADLPRFLWAYDKPDGLDVKDSQLIDLIRLVLTDFTANCNKTDFPVKTNERTPYVESIVPIFKYLSSVQRSVSFVWCEKGLLIPKATKLMDGIGMSVSDKKERVPMESSGLDDDMHTNEDTLKLLEYTSMCIQAEKSHYQQSSYATFVKRRLFAIQFVGYKLTLLTTFIGMNNLWTCLLERTATIPSCWSERIYWIQAFELTVKLMDMLEDQDQVTEKLISEHNGLVSVAKEDTMRHHDRMQATTPHQP